MQNVCKMATKLKKKWFAVVFYKEFSQKKSKLCLKNHESKIGYSPLRAVVPSRSNRGIIFIYSQIQITVNDLQDFNKILRLTAIQTFQFADNIKTVTAVRIVSEVL